MLNQGIYEEIISQKLQNELDKANLDIEIGRTPLDVEEARKVLSSYISSVTRSALKHVRSRKKRQRRAS
jgi:hypothetical protein